jgi:16S rRNA (guanine966-N2)-methyltransferase
MTRIISGKWKSLTLRVPQSVTRPTASRVREAIFSTLMHELQNFSDIELLDLYAGSGALGIEAISRGATRATFVDNDRHVIKIINANLSGLSNAKTSVVRSNAASFLNQTEEVRPVDLVFIDPPYTVVDAVVEGHLATLVSRGWLKDQALVVVEREAKSQVEWPAGFRAFKPRIYGGTSIWYGRYEGEVVADEEGTDS